jgi:hypothetical protein
MILAPLFLQIFYTFTLLFLLAFVRTRHILKREVKMKDVALGQKNWPELATKISNCFQNQFETPILFYVLTILVWQSHTASIVFTAGSWAFVLARFAHGYIEISGNHVPTRFKAFVFGTVSLLIMWIDFVVRTAIAA